MGDMKKRDFKSTCEQIAAEVQKTIRGTGEVTADQVARVALGIEVSESHPVIARIYAACERAGITIKPQQPKE